MSAVPAMGVVAETVMALEIAGEVLRKFGGGSIAETLRKFGGGSIAETLRNLDAYVAGLR